MILSFRWFRQNLKLYNYHRRCRGDDFALLMDDCGRRRARPTQPEIRGVAAPPSCGPLWHIAPLRQSILPRLVASHALHHTQGPVLPLREFRVADRTGVSFNRFCSAHFGHRKFWHLLFGYGWRIDSVVIDILFVIGMSDEIRRNNRLLHSIEVVVQKAINECKTMIFRQIMLSLQLKHKPNNK